MAAPLDHLVLQAEDGALAEIGGAVPGLPHHHIEPLRTKVTTPSNELQ
jgi:hypothetical protein